ncbi:hypothetical protein [Marinobacter changyiensis]|nr:hypothetical protein [Marinobacter changyiensis]
MPLAFEPAEPDVMKRQPRPRNESLLVGLELETWLRRRWRY